MQNNLPKCHITGAKLIPPQLTRTETELMRRQHPEAKLSQRVRGQLYSSEIPQDVILGVISRFGQRTLNEGERKTVSQTTRWGDAQNMAWRFDKPDMSWRDK